MSNFHERFVKKQMADPEFTTEYKKARADEHGRGDLWRIRQHRLHEALEHIAKTTPHIRGCDEPDDPDCAACIAAAALAADLEA